MMLLIMIKHCCELELIYRENLVNLLLMVHFQQQLLNNKRQSLSIVMPFKSGLKINHHKAQLHIDWQQM